MAQSLARLCTHLIFSTKNRFPFCQTSPFGPTCTDTWQKYCESMIAKLW